MRLSEVNADNKNARIDSQFHTKKNVKTPHFKYVKIGSILKKSQYGISISMNENDIGYPIYRMNEIHNMMCDSEVKKSAVINEKQLQEFQLNDRDVLFNRTNSFKFVGRTGIYKSNNSDKLYVFASYLVRFVPNEIYILPEYLTVFLNCKSTILQIKSRARQSINQSNVNPEEIKDIEIPLLSLTFQQVIKSCFDQSHKKQIKSTQLYTKAEQLLLLELDLVNFVPSTENIAIKKLSDSFKTTGRLDAEYYQPKYEEVLEKIKKTRYNVLSEIVVIKKSIEPGSNAYQDSGIPFVRIADFSKEGISHSNVYLNPNFLDAKKLNNLYPKKDTILFSKDGTIGTAYNIKTQENIITSSALLHLKIKSSYVLPEYLALVLNSIIVKLQGDKDTGGSIIKHWIPSEIEKILIPIIDLELQQQIEAKMQESFTLRKESKRLLDVAKQAVEMAIEQNEEVAMNWLNKTIPSKENINETS